MSVKSLSPFESWKDRWVVQVESALLSKLNSLKDASPSDSQRLILAMEHTLASGGKRLRPLLCLSAARAAGGEEEGALPGALAVELIHTYSLIHDDLPALDNDPLRRGKASCHLAFDEATAILAGDAFQALAFEILAEAVPDHPKRALSAVKILAKAVGPLGMVGGQVLDLAFEGKSPTKDEQSLMVKKKTGELIAASMAIGMALGGGSLELMEIGHLSGLLLGEAFQIQDDLLNSEGDPKLLGKAVGTDATRGKASILNYLSANEALKLSSLKLEEAKSLIEALHSDMLLNLFDSLINRKS
ncbi:MAG: polyprenyl synthetase family protein [Deltaproteobacteria bacterium]|jgi:geranylgeranyl diphosphate synthase type II|nr:polyprenyl synthetase family protein [Deltaproteobacteria bacterium]